MILWRISNYSDLSGVGGLRYDGRWHSKGRPVVYLAAHPASALLETLVHLEIETLDDLPDTYQLLEVNVPDSVPDSGSLISAALPADWPAGYAPTQAVGDLWLIGAASLLLEVPSVLIPDTFNYLLNPRHPEARQVSIKSVRRYPYDGRLFKVVAVPLP